MKYTVVVEIQRARDDVIALFDSQDNIHKWQPELISFEHLEGEPGQVGAKSRLRYTMGRREIEMIETITRRELPDRFDATYEADGVYNTVDSLFEEAGPSRTRWTIDTEFKCKGFTRIMAFFMPGVFKKETLRYMNLFKNFAEGEATGSADASEDQANEN